MNFKRRNKEMDQVNLKGCVKNNWTFRLDPEFFTYFCKVTGKDCMYVRMYVFRTLPFLSNKTCLPNIGLSTKLLNVYKDSFLYTVNCPAVNVKFLLFMRCLSKVNRIVIFGSVRSDKKEYFQNNLSYKLTIILWKHLVTLHCS